MTEFPDVSFKTLDQVLLDLSRAGVLCARGDGAYSLSMSQGVAAVGRPCPSQGRKVGGGGVSQESPKFNPSQGSQARVDPATYFFHATDCPNYSHTWTAAM